MLLMITDSPSFAEHNNCCADTFVYSNSALSLHLAPFQGANSAALEQQENNEEPIETSSFPFYHLPPCSLRNKCNPLLSHVIIITFAKAFQVIFFAFTKFNFESYLVKEFPLISSLSSFFLLVVFVMESGRSSQIKISI